ncbi:MAG: tRNA-dihydrouridine synthase [Rectinemataceae bacterium]|nr:tRNA-dihydrouridine synthase [Rectinemataceae bacterium]
MLDSANVTMSTNFWKQLDRPILALAPMVGITDSAFRLLARQWGADVVYSEMISADALVHNAKKAHAMMDHETAEFPLVVQLMGNEPAVLAKAARMAADRGVSGIDINFGCPAHKIARNFCGAMLMRDLDRCRRLIVATIEAVDIPVSIKVRVSIKKERSHGMEPSHITILDFLEKVSDLPIAAIMVHGRSFEDPFDGGVRVDMIRAVKERFNSGPVIANGGITTIESSAQLLEETGADGIGLARSVIGKPWLFRQIRQYLETGTYEAMEWDMIQSTVIDHAMLFDRLRGDVPFVSIRKHLSHYVRGIDGASALRQKLVLASSSSEVASILQHG